MYTNHFVGMSKVEQFSLRPQQHTRLAGRGHSTEGSRCLTLLSEAVRSQLQIQQPGRAKLRFSSGAAPLLMAVGRYTCLHIYIFTYIHIRIYMYIYIYVYINTYIYIYVFSYTYTYILTYIFAYNIKK